METNEDGAFAFDRTDLGSAPHGAIVWVTHPEHLAAHAALAEVERRTSEADPPTAPSLRSRDIGTVTLEPAPRRTAWVQATGDAVQAAKVLQFALADDVASPDQARARLAFFREWTTDAQGRAALASFEGREGLLAKHEDLQSEPVARECTGDVALELVPTFRALGSVILDDGATMPDGIRVHGEVRPGEDWERRASTPVRADGTWGALTVALGAADAYRFVVEGAEVVREDVEIALPEAGQTVEVDIETRIGLDKWFVVLDAESGDKLTEARVETYWRDEFARWVMVEHRARDDGYILAHGLPPGPIYYIARCPGYAFQRGGPDVVPAPEAFTREMELFRAGRLEGRCTHAGSPVENFQLLYWPRNRPEQLAKESFEGRADGRFVIEEVAAGDLTILARGRDLGQCESVRLTVPAGGTAEVELELPAGENGRGTVVDQLTGAPIAGAEAEILFTYGAWGMHTAGITAVTDSEGRFELPGFSRVQTTFSVAAPGYSQRNVSARAKGSTAVDLGRIELSPAQPLEIRLHTGQGDDPTQYTVQSVGKAVPLSHFSADGLVFVEDFFTGLVNLRVNAPNGEGQYQIAMLPPGDDWVVDVHFDGPCRLDLRVASAPTAPAPEGHFAVVKYPDDRGGVDRQVYVPESGIVTFENLPPGPVHVQLKRDRTTVASVPFEIAMGQENALKITLDGKLGRLRVVDAAGQPMASTRVHFLVDGRGEARLGGTTDARGELACGGIDHGELEVHLEHPDAGFASHVPVARGSSPDETMDVTFEAGESLSVVIVDGDETLSNIPCQLYWTTSIEPLEAELTTDGAGRVSWEQVGEGEYVLDAQHPLYWPVRTRLTTSPTPHQVQMRRRGDLLVKATDASGSALAGAPVRIESAEFATDVSDWVRSGALEGVTTPLLTNADGELELVGLPRGEYRWHVEDPSGAGVTGSVTVPGGERVVALARVP